MKSAIVVALSSAILFFSSVCAADYKVATVDMEKVISQSSEFKSSRQALDQKVLAAKKKVEAKRSELKGLEEKLKKAKVKEGDKEAEDFRNQYREYTRLVKDTDEDLRKETLKSYKTLSDKALKLIRAYASDNNLSLVLDKSEAVRGPVLFGSANFDITEEILKKVD